MIQIRDVAIGAGKPKVCVCLTGTTEIEIIDQAKEAARSAAEIVEWRADFFSDRNDDTAVYRILKMIRMAISDKVFIFSLRTTAEGGQASVKDEEYIHIGKVAAGSRLIDILDVECCVSEYRSMELISYAKERNVYLLGSNYSFNKNLSSGEMEYRIRYMQRLGIDMARIAVNVDRKRDVYKLLCTSYELCDELEFPLSVYGIGSASGFTKVAGEFFGSCMVFGTLDEDPSVEDGTNAYQLSEAIHLMHEIAFNKK